MQFGTWPCSLSLHFFKMPAPNSGAQRSGPGHHAACSQEYEPVSEAEADRPMLRVMGGGGDAFGARALKLTGRPMQPGDDVGGELVDDTG